MMIRSVLIFFSFWIAPGRLRRYADRQVYLNRNPLDDGRGEAKVVTFDGFWQCQAHARAPYDAAIQNVNINANQRTVMLIDAACETHIDIVEYGASRCASVFEAILLQLWIKRFWVNRLNTGEILC